MPIPKPRPDENKDEFIQRCMADPVMVEEYEPGQRYAICNSQWNDKKELTMDKLYELIEIKIDKSDDENRTITAIGTKEIVDRDGDIVKVEGIDYKNYLKNPVVLWSHNIRDLPIGKAKKVWKDGKKLMFKIQFASGDESPIAPYIYKLYKGGYLKSFSIGFAPNWEKVEYKEKNGKQVRIINESELFEISAVNVPANPGAIITSIDKAWSDGVLDGDELNKIYDIINEMKKQDELIYYKLELEAAEKKIKELVKENELLKMELETQENEHDIYEELYNEYKVIRDDKDIIDELLNDLK